MRMSPRKKIRVMPLMVAVKSPQADRVEARGPDFIGGERGHDVGFGFAH